MVGAVTFDFGGAYAPAFPLPDASGLMPLSLPEEFLHRHESSMPQPSSDAVMRFEAAMGAEPLASHLAGIKNLVVASAVATGPLPKVSMGTDPVQVVGTDPFMEPAIVKECEVSCREVPVASDVPVEMEVTVAPNRESYAAPVVASARVVQFVQTPEVEPGAVAQATGTDPMPQAGIVAQTVGTDPKQAMGTVPMPQAGIVAENGAEKPILAKNSVSVESPVVGAKVVVPNGTGFVQIVGTDPITKPVGASANNYMRTVGTDPMPQAGIVAQTVGTDPKQAMGTVPMPQAGIVAENGAEKPVLVKNPVSVESPVVEANVVEPKGVDSVQVVGTDHIPKGTDPVTTSAVMKECEVPGREVPVDTKVPVAPNKESYVSPVVASAKDVPVAPVQEAEVVTVVGKVAEPTSKTVLPTEAKLSQETTKPAPEATRLAHETLVQVPETAKPIIEVAKPTIEAAKPTVGAEPEIRLEAAPAIDKAEPEDEMVALDAKQTQPLQAMPVVVTADSAGTVDAQSATAREVSAVSAATARTEAVVEVVDKLIEAVVSQISVTPSLVHGEGEVHMTLKANVLDGSDITLSAKGGDLAVVVTPATPGAAQAVAAAAPRLEVALAEHVPTFRNVVVKLGSVSRKGNSDETA